MTIIGLGVMLTVI